MLSSSVILRSSPSQHIFYLDEHERELEDSRKFSLNSLMMFLGIHLIAGSKALAPLTNALIIYTIALHLAVSASFLQSFPTVSKLLHGVPLLGVSCMAAAEFAMDARSPTVVAGCASIAVLPLLVMAVYHVRSRAESAPILPVRSCDVRYRE